MHTLDLEGSVIIRRPLEEVWAFMEDPERAGDWQPYLVELRQEPPGNNGIGTEQFYIFQYLGRRFSNHYVVTEYEPMERSAYKSLPDSSIQATGENLFEPLDDGTRLTMTFTPQVGGFFGKMPKSIGAWSYRRTLNGNLKRIKKILESRV